MRSQHTPTTSGRNSILNNWEHNSTVYLIRAVQPANQMLANIPKWLQAFGQTFQEKLFLQVDIFFISLHFTCYKLLY